MTLNSSASTSSHAELTGRCHWDQTQGSVHARKKKNHSTNLSSIPTPKPHNAYIAKFRGWRAKIQWLRALAALPEDPGLFPRTPVSWLTMAHYSSWDSDSSGLCKHTLTWNIHAACTHTPIQLKYAFLKNSIKNKTALRTNPKIKGCL